MNELWRFIKFCFLILRAYVFNVLLALDLLLNAVIGGDPRETVSSRLGKGALAKKPVHIVGAKVVNFIFKLLFNQKDHCFDAIEPSNGKGAISEVIDRYKAGEGKIWFL